MQEETASLLPTYSTAGGEERAHAPDEVQSPFINKGALHKKVTEIGAFFFFFIFIFLAPTRMRFS